MPYPTGTSLAEKKIEKNLRIDTVGNHADASVKKKIKLTRAPDQAVCLNASDALL